MFKKPDYIRAHKHSSSHRREIIQSNTCGCFYCFAMFAPNEISTWVDEVNEIGQTALCPVCEIDSVIGDKSGYPITKEFLRKIHQHWF